MGHRKIPRRVGAGGIGMVISGLDSIEEAIKKAPEEAIKIAGRAMHKAGEDVMGESKEKYCPVATGALRGSGYVAPPKKKGEEITVEMGYGGPAAPYALAVHENPRSGKTGGISPSGKQYARTMGGKATWAEHGEWKYLETPLKQQEKEIEQKIYRDIDAGLGR